MQKKRILIDLDGVLNTYSGGFDENNIPPLKDGAIEFLESLYESYELVLFSSRNLESVRTWVEKYKIKKFFTDYTNQKQCAFLTIDDRCIRFEGNFTQTLESIKNFSVWWNPSS